VNPPRNSDGALIVAVRRGFVEYMRPLLDAGVNINPDMEPYKSLFERTQKTRIELEVAKLLREYGLVLSN
jgi:hypothetical protein